MGYRFRRTRSGGRDAAGRDHCCRFGCRFGNRGRRCDRRGGAKLPGTGGPDHRAGDARVERRHFGPGAGRRHVGAIRQAVIVVNKPGANGVLGSADVARAKADGYMLMHGATYSVTVQPLTDKDAGYTVKSFTPICQTFKNDQVIVVPPDSPLKTAKDIVEAAKQKPGALNVGIPGIATIPHLAMIQLAQQAQVEFNDVPFKGPAEEIQNTRSGQLDFSAVPLTAAAGSGLAMPGLFAATRN